MLTTTRRIAAAALAAVFLCGTALSQTGHPAKGSWLGYWGPNEDDQRRMRLLLDWENRAVSGTINPGRNGIEITRASIDYDSWTLTIEANMPTDSGGADRFVATGVLENLGSWTNRRYSGTYTFGSERGSFDLMLN